MVARIGWLSGECLVCGGSSALKLHIDPSLRELLEQFADEIQITTHRVIFKIGGQYIAYRLDEVKSLILQGKLIGTDRVVVDYRYSIYKLSLIIGESELRMTVYQTLTRLIAQQPWLESGYREAPSIGGLSTLAVRERRTASNAKSVANAGLADILSLKKYASEVKETIQKLRNSTNQSEQSAYKKMLVEYGLDSSILPSSLAVESKVNSLIVQAVRSSPQGVMFAHDLYCIVNRGLKLETIISPKQFMTTIDSMSRRSVVGSMEVEKYTIVYNPSRFDTARIKDLIVQYDKECFAIEEFAKLINLTDVRLAQSILIQIELESGIVCRDDGGEYGDRTFYKNTYFS